MPLVPLPFTGPYIGHLERDVTLHVQGHKYLVFLPKSVFILQAEVAYRVDTMLISGGRLSVLDQNELQNHLLGNWVLFRDIPGRKCFLGIVFSLVPVEACITYLQATHKYSTFHGLSIRVMSSILAIVTSESECATKPWLDCSMMIKSRLRLWQTSPLRNRMINSFTQTSKTNP
jgi:hypothetical protein